MNIIKGDWIKYNDISGKVVGFSIHANNQPRAIIDFPLLPRRKIIPIIKLKKI